jgi:glycosyltransferase involved in cell wall biosynthesis
MEMDTTPRTVSLVVATINPRPDIENLVASISVQNPKPHQIVVVDSSPDGSVKRMFEKYKLSDILSYVQQKPSGIYAAWNLALQHVTGSLVWFIGDDDELSPGTMYSITQTVSKKEMSSQQTFLIPVQRSTGLVKFNPKSSWQWKFGAPKSFEHSGFICSVSLFKQYGGFSEAYRIAGDYEWLLRLFLSSGILTNLCLIDDCPPLIKGVKGISSTDKRRIFREFRHIRRQHRLSSYTSLDFAIDLREWARAICRHFRN